MKHLLLLICLFLCSANALLYASQDVEVSDAVRQAVPNIEVLSEGIVAGGAPEVSAFKAIKENGFKTVIDLRTPEEGIDAERKAVEALGMKYVNIPMSSRDVSEAQVEKLSASLTDDAYPVLMHCRSGGRVNALWSEYQKKNDQAE